MSRLSIYALGVLAVMFNISCVDETPSLSPSGQQAQSSSGPKLSEARAAIIGGVEESGWPGVGALTTRVAGSGYIGSFCTGTLIESDWVLTAAHCLEGSDPNGFSVTPQNTRFFLGEDANPRPNGRPPQGSFYQADRFVIHPSYNDDNFENDIALVHLSEPAIGVVTYPINTANLTRYTGDDATYIGYGMDDGVNQSGSGVKRSTQIEIGQVDTLAYYSIYEGSGICFGDSGGPGMLTVQGQWKIVGVNSAVAGEIPCEEFYISARVDAYASWINSQLGAPAPDCRQDAEICLCADACQDDGSCDQSACETLGCEEIYTCLNDCNQDAGCQSACYLRGSDEGSQRFDDLLTCYSEECGELDGPAFSECATRECATEIEACFPRVTGETSCAEVSACFSRCSREDRGCQESCWESGSEEAQDQIIELNQCVNDACNTQDSEEYFACLERSCSEPYLDCYPPDSCDLTGGDCARDEACYIGFAGETYCYPSLETEVGEQCSPETQDALDCEDGAVCYGTSCVAMCADASDCAQGERCDRPLFEGNNEIGACLCESDREVCGDGADNDCDQRVDEGCMMSGGEMTGGEMTGGEMAGSEAGEMSAGQMSAGEMSAGGASGGEMSVGEAGDDVVLVDDDMSPLDPQEPEEDVSGSAVAAESCATMSERASSNLLSLLLVLGALLSQARRRVIDER